MTSDEDKKPPHRNRAKAQEKEIPGKQGAIKKLEAAMRAVAKTESGQLLLRHIMTQCGYKEPSTIMNPVTKEILEYATIFNEAKRGLWLDMRKLIPVPLRNIIEADEE